MYFSLFGRLFVNEDSMLCDLNNGHPCRGISCCKPQLLISRNKQITMGIDFEASGA